MAFISTANSYWQKCHCHNGELPCRVPPAPHVLPTLYLQYQREAQSGVSFAQYLKHIGFEDPSANVNGMDDSIQAQPIANNAGVQLISAPTIAIAGELRIIVLLVDFPDRPGTLSKGHYEDLLFSKGKHPTGSMHDYFSEVSNQKVEVIGSVHGWIRMAKPYRDYLGTNSGMEPADYPGNCQGLAEEATIAALKAGVYFPTELDKFGRNHVTALFIVHSGMGAESFPTKEQQRQEIWSHKWNFVKPVAVSPAGLTATTYLVVPQNCRLGVCAHELGHLAFQWQDFYDPNYNDDGQFWNGTGMWDLMASGCYNNGSTRPAHPAILHKVQHRWVQLVELSESEEVALKPSSAPGGRALRINSPEFTNKQFLLVENRPRRGFDEYLPGEGLLIWRIDMDKEMFAPATPGMQLVQADGRNELERPLPDYQGDDADPFPGSGGVTMVSDGLSKDPSTSFPGKRSGITLSDIRFDEKGVVHFKVTISKPKIEAVSTQEISTIKINKLQTQPQKKPPLNATIRVKPK